MRKRLFVVAALAFAAAMAVPSLAMASAKTGNGAPSGPHFTLNIHGVANSNGTSFSGANKNDIFVPLTGRCTIKLAEGTPFEVLQPDCTKGTPAKFQLPNPCASTTCTTYTYQVWVRALTKGSATARTCFTTKTTGTTFCDTSLVVTLKKATPPKFENVTNDLLSVCVTGQVTPIFATANKTYFWQYTNHGLRLAQFRFYAITQPSNVGAACTSTKR